MFLLIVGIALWVLAHLFKRLAPEARAKMGDRGKGPVALLILAGVVLMVIGYRMTDDAAYLWDPPYWLRHVNNLLVLIAIFLMSPAPKKGRLLNGMRHPMLTGFALWAFAHLLVNGDVAAITMFGAFLVWALVEMALINRAEPAWTPPEPGSYAKDGMFLVGSVILMGVIGYIHGLLGYPVFG